MTAGDTLCPRADNPLSGLRPIAIFVLQRRMTGSVDREINLRLADFRPTVLPRSSQRSSTPSLIHGKSIRPRRFTDGDGNQICQRTGSHSRETTRFRGFGRSKRGIDSFWIDRRFHVSLTLEHSSEAIPLSGEISLPFAKTFRAYARFSCQNRLELFPRATAAKK